MPFQTTNNIDEAYLGLAPGRSGADERAYIGLFNVVLVVPPAEESKPTVYVGTGTRLGMIANRSGKGFGTELEEYSRKRRLQEDDEEAIALLLLAVCRESY